MKRCPICGAHAVEGAATCFECLYHFDTLSTEDVCRLERSAAEAVTAADLPAAATSGAPVFMAPARSDRCFTVEARFGATGELHATAPRGSFYIGRAVFNDLVIDEELIIRRHAHLYRLEQGVFMELLSIEATATVNGQASTHISLIRDGDVIGLGSCDVVVRC
ncbi:MAG: FHA domain-containing protein [Actinomycetia bacterium]|nr:FHA domain-containing protein [Actinomycetes bacterium]